jgi:hypothetical protein
MRLAYREKVCTPVWSPPASSDAVGPSRGVARVCRASACACTFSVFTFEVLCGASCGN